ncbi:FxLYD domain-containing protein [Streptomyces hebeiensis]
MCDDAGGRASSGHTVSGTFQTRGVIVSNGYPPPQQPQQPWGQPPQPGAWQQPGPWGPPPPPKKKTSAALIVTLSVVGGLVLLLIVGAVASSGGGDEAPAAKKPDAVAEKSKGEEPAADPAPVEEKKPAEGEPEADVKITECSVDEFTKWPAADIEIVNSTGEKANYIVSIEFVDGDGTRLASALAATNDVAAGQKTKEKAQSLDKVEEKVTCKVSKVSRYPSL